MHALNPANEVLSVSTSYLAFYQNYSAAGAPYGGIGSKSKVGLDEVDTDTGKLVLESHETVNKGEILASGGLLPVTDYHVLRDVVRGVQGKIQGDWKNHVSGSFQRRWGYNYICSAFSVTHGKAPPPDWNRLRTEAHANANSAAFDLMTNLAELPESLAMARNFFAKLKERAIRIRNLRKVRASRSFEEFYRLFSEAWLEYRYGWRPLIGAADDLREAVNLLGNEKTYLPVSGRSSTTTTAPGVMSASWSAISFTNSHVNTSTRSSEHRSFVTHLVRKEAAAISINPLVTAWELVPYSFVIDWFTGIGDTIQANYKPPGVAQTAAGSSTKSVSEGTSTSGTPALIPFSLVQIPGSFTMRREEYQRWKDSELPPPPSMMSQMDRMSLAQWIDLGFLAEGLLKRLFGA